MRARDIETWRRRRKARRYKALADKFLAAHRVFIGEVNAFFRQGDGRPHG